MTLAVLFIVKEYGLGFSLVIKPPKPQIVHIIPQNSFVIRTREKNYCTTDDGETILQREVISTKVEQI
jgi:hypothetical protein